MAVRAVPGVVKRYRYVSPCMMLAELWYIRFSVKPWQDFLETGKWDAEFDATAPRQSGGGGLPRIGSCSGDTVEAAAKKLLMSYINLYGAKMPLPYATVRSEEELVAKYEFIGKRPW